MNLKILLYLFVSIIVIFACDSIDINRFFKKNKIFQARIAYFLIVISLIYIVTNFIFDFFVYSKII